MDLFDFLKRVFFFKNLSDDELKLVLTACHEDHYEPGAVLFIEGDVADRFFIVIEGHVEVWKNYYEAKPDLLGLHGPGHFFGEMALVDELPRSATVVARDKVHALFLNRDAFRSLVREHSAIAISVMTSMSFLVRSANEIYVDDLRRRNEQLEKAYAELEMAQAERLRNERLSTLGKFSSMILHDIRNPLSIIKGQLALMRLDTSDSARVERSIVAAESETAKLERLSCEFLDYSRGDIRLNISIVEPASILDAVAASIGPKLEFDGIAMIIDCKASGPALIDYDRIQRALFNLVDNARKALYKASTRNLRLSSAYDGDNLVFEVEDSGVGMVPEVLDRIYEPFYSASGLGGTGLGLLIVRNIVEAHGGTLSVRSAPGIGTVFTIRVPRRAS